MEKKVAVMSLVGSIIIPEKINIKTLNEFRKVILKNTTKYKFVVVCGGGKTARNYINGLNNENLKEKTFFQSNLGIAATRLNARFLTYFFNKDANSGIPHDMHQVQSLLRKHDVVFCGALRYSPNQTSDTTTAKLANYFGTPFINLTDVSGLYDKNPKEFKNAKYIPNITHKEFLKMAKKIEFKPGQNFVLDQKAARIINEHNITTFLLGPDMENLDNLLNGKHFIGSIIKD
jgi:uridylate kinase